MTGLLQAVPQVVGMLSMQDVAVEVSTNPSQPKTSLVHSIAEKVLVVAMSVSAVVFACGFFIGDYAGTITRITGGFSTFASVVSYIFFRNSKVQKKWDELIANQQKGNEEFQKKIDDLEKGNAELSLRNGEFQKRVEELLKGNQELSKRNDEFEKRVHELEEGNLKLKNNVKELTEQIESLTSLAAKISGASDEFLKQNQFLGGILQNADKVMKEADALNDERDKVMSTLKDGCNEKLKAFEQALLNLDKQAGEQKDIIQGLMDKAGGDFRKLLDKAWHLVETAEKNQKNAEDRALELQKINTELLNRTMELQKEISQGRKNEEVIEERVIKLLSESDVILKKSDGKK